MILLLIPALAGVLYAVYLAFSKEFPAFVVSHIEFLADHTDNPKAKVQSLKGFINGPFAICLYVTFSCMNRGVTSWGDHIGWGVAFFVILFWVGFEIDVALEREYDYYVNEVKPARAVQTVIEQQNPSGWASFEEIERAFVAKDATSLINVGGHMWLPFDRKGHVLTIGSSRAGKGASLLVPALLDPFLNNKNGPSFVVLDPRGENLAISGDYLQKKGYRLIVLNPYNIEEIKHFDRSGFNPFDQFTADTPNFNKHVDLIRFAIVPSEQSRHQNSYFGEAASDIIGLYIRYMMMQEGEPKNIVTLYRMLRKAGSDRAELLKKMGDISRFDIADDAAAIAQQLAEGGKSITDVYANANVATGMFRDEEIRQSMLATDFKIEDIAKEKTALFICLGAEDMDRMKVWMRLVLASIMRGFLRNYNVDRKVTLLLDEFSSLGFVSEFNNVQILANYNVTAWVVVQDLNQLKNLYPAVWETFVNNSIIRHWIRIGDNFTAEYLSKRLGNTLIFLGKNPDGSPKYEKKPLLTPAEIMAFPDIIMESEGVKPIRLARKPYWEFSKVFTENPFYKKSSGFS